MTYPLATFCKQCGSNDVGEHYGGCDGTVKPTCDILDTARRVLELAGKATAGPWKSVNYGGFWEPQTTEDYTRTSDLLDEEKTHRASANCAFITDARTSAPLLAQAVIDLTAEVERLKAQTVTYRHVGELKPMPYPLDD